MNNARDIIDHLGLEPHPEGGWFKEMYRDDVDIDGRAICTSIYYLLEQGQRSHWHKVDAVEIWHFYAGAPLQLSMSPDGRASSTFQLGNDVLNGQAPQLIVPKDHWQSAETMGSYTLVGCTVSPGFEFSGFILAPEAWSPGSEI